MIGPKFLKRALIVGAMGSLFVFAGNAQAGGFSVWGGYGGGHCYTPPPPCYGGYGGYGGYYGGYSGYGGHSYSRGYSYGYSDRHYYSRSRHHGYSGHRGYDHSRYRSHGWRR